MSGATYRKDAAAFLCGYSVFALPALVLPPSSLKHFKIANEKKNTLQVYIGGHMFQHLN